MKQKIMMLVAASACVIFLAACDKPGVDADIVVRVNGDEITRQQLESALAASGASTPEQKKELGVKMLERLIDQQLLAQKATESRLDQDVIVRANVENSKLQILSQRYIDRAIADMPKPGEAEIRKYYEEHPLMFAQRRIYRVQEFVATVNESQARQLHAMLDKSKDLNEAAKWMRSNGIPFSGDISIRAAEQVPMEQLPNYHKMKAGDFTVLAGPGRVLVTQVMAVREAPLSEKDAAPIIVRYLTNQQRAEIGGAEVKKLRGKANIEYLGEHAKVGTTELPGGGKAGNAPL